MSERILIVDDEPEIVSMVEQSFRNEGYEVFTAADGRQALKQLETQPDLIILDVMMPNLNGFDLCQMIRDEVNCPILFVSAKHTETDRIQGLSIGGDDYITKPFSLRELKARVAAHLRRNQREVSRGDHRRTLRYGLLQIDIHGREVKIGQTQIPFTVKEFEIVENLALHPGQVFTKEQLYDKIWGLEAVGDAATITEHVKKIRAKLSVADPNCNFISTVWGVGYKWEALHS
ncbi:Alkaline phosphatase synthesis transcriptional regulatory protein SphR [compost metagenome]